MVGDLIKADGIGALDGIFVIDAVDLGGLDQNLGADLARTKSRCGVDERARPAGCLRA